MLKLQPRTQKQKEKIGSALMSLGNGILLVLTFGQFVSDKPFSLGVYFLGFFLCVVCYWMADVIMRYPLQTPSTLKAKKVTVQEFLKKDLHTVV